MNECSIKECSATRYTEKSGLCRPHYRKLRKYGDPEYVAPIKPRKACDGSGCARLARTKTSKHCETHYQRLYRGGDIGPAGTLIRTERLPECSVEGCDKGDDEVGYCRMHAARMRRHGDVNKRIEAWERNLPTGEAHPHWAGTRPGYGAAHDRVKRLRGSASEHRCADCNGPAYHWSYDHADPDELSYEYAPGKHAAYSHAPEHYAPRCVPCHKRYDLDRRDSMVA